MKIRHIHIHNYRSIHDLELYTQDWMVFLGPNNHGKSNLLSAIEFFLTGSMKPVNNDFFYFRETEDSELWVDISFDNLTEQEKHTFQKYVRNDGVVKIRKFARLESSSNIEVGYRGYIAEPNIWWLQSSAFEQLSSREKIEAESVTEPALKALLDTGGRITRQLVEEFQQKYVRNHEEEIEFTETLEENPLLGRVTVAAGVLPDFYLVPAIKDVVDETKIKGTTLFGRLLQRTVQAMMGTDAQFVEIHERLVSLISEINQRGEVAKGYGSGLAQLEADLSEELRAWGVNVSIQVAPPEMEKLFEFGTQLQIDDGHRTEAERKGHGLQRAVIFALLRTWAKALHTKPEDSGISARRASESIIFVIEEPELFLHPHAQRQLARDLQEIAATPGNQVFICSHSTHFVNLDWYKSIVIIRKDDVKKGTTATQCTQDLFEGDSSDDKKHRFQMAAWVNPDRGELFFARKVILVEGETEHASFPFLASKLECFDPGVTVINCGSKHNLPLYIQILNAFGIKYVVVHDEDPLPDPIPDDWNVNMRDSKRNTFNLNAKIAAEINNDFCSTIVLSPDFEGEAGISKNQSDKKGKPIAALDHFESLPIEQIPDRICSIVRSLYCQD